MLLSKGQVVAARACTLQLEHALYSWPVPTLQVYPSHSVVCKRLYQYGQNCVNVCTHADGYLGSWQPLCRDPSGGGGV